MGPSSTWGFAWRVRRLLTALPSNSTNEDPTEVDDMAYLYLNEPTSTHPQDAHLLPRETKKRYMSNYLYHIAPIWHFIDPDVITSELGRHCEDFSTDCVPLLRHIQFNLVMAIGKLLENSVKRERSPSESYFRFALNAMETMNESKSIAREPILVAQNLCLTSFYLHAINVRNDAYVQVRRFKHRRRPRAV